MKAIGTVNATPADIGPEHKRLQKAAHQLEGVFMAQLLSAMRQTVSQDGIVQTDGGQEMFTSMLDQKIADISARRSAHGVGEQLYHQLSRQLPEGK